jgi:hypothetical protein
MFMNEGEIEMVRERYRNHPVLGEATETLYRFMCVVDRSSDGWPYWKAAPRAAKKLMELIGKPEMATPEGLKKALTPIKSFLTKNKLTGV